MSEGSTSARVVHRFLPSQPLGGGAFGTVFKVDLYVDRLRFARCACKVQRDAHATVEVDLLHEFALDPHLPPTISWSYSSAVLRSLPRFTFVTYSSAVLPHFMLGLRLPLLLHALRCYGFTSYVRFSLLPLSTYHFPLWVMPADVQVIL